MIIKSARANDVVARPVRWLVNQIIPFGELTILGGAPGLGKSQLALAVAAEASRGALRGDLSGPVDVAFVSVEDSIPRTLVPRLLAAGGDPARVHFFEGKQRADCDEHADALIELPADVPLVREWLERTHSRLLVLDPLIALIPAAFSGHKDQHVRQALAPLARVAQELDVAVLALMHLTKDREADALNRLNGSVGFGAAARSVLLLAPDPDDPEGENGSRRVLAHVKSNLGPRQPSVSYGIESRVIESREGSVTTSVIVCQGGSAFMANDLLGKPREPGDVGVRDEACAFLRAELSQGAVATNTLKQQAAAAGINWRTVERAKKELRIRARKARDGWGWELPTPEAPPGGVVGLVGLDAGNADNTDKAVTVASPEGLVEIAARVGGRSDERLESTGEEARRAEIELARLRSKFDPESP